MSPGLAGRLEVPYVPYHSLSPLDKALTHLLCLSFFVTLYATGFACLTTLWRWTKVAYVECLEMVPGTVEALCKY